MYSATRASVGPALSMLQMVNARSISSCRLMRLTESSASDMIPPSLRRTNYFWTTKIRKNFAFHESVLRLRLENTGVEGLRLLQAEPPRLHHFSMECWNPPG